MAQRGGGPSSSFDDAADVTHSTAFVVLNALVDEGQISEERAEYLKQKFTDLHSRVLAIYKRDNALLKRARQLRSRLEAERQRVYSCGDTAKKDDEVIQNLKRTLMEQERDLTAALERESVLQVEVLEYDRRKQHLILEREDAVAAEEARLRPKMETMQAEITEMSNHIKELAAEQEKYEEEQKRLKEEEDQCKEEISNFTTTLAQAKQQLQNVQSDPDRARKQHNLVVGSLAGAQRELTNTEEKIAAHAERITALELQRDSRAGDSEAVKKRVQNIRTELDAKRKTLATMNTSLEVELETRQAAQERVAELDQLILTARLALQQEEDGVERMEREKEKCMRLYSALEQAKDNARHAHEGLQEQVRLVVKEEEQVKQSITAIKKETAGYRRDIEGRTKKLLAEQAKSKEFITQADGVLLEIREAEETLTARMKQDEVRHRELKAVGAKRQELSRASAREAARVALAQQELQMRELFVKEAHRRNAELEKRLTKLVDMFQKVKRARAQKATQIQTITQAMTQVAEKTKLLERELAVLTRESALKDQEISKSKYQVHELTQVCANLRLEKNRLRRSMEKATDSEREVKAQVRRLNADIAATEDTMVDLRRSYAAAVEARNQTGIQLIDRNDEAALLVARVKAQETAIAEGTKMTNARAIDVRLLKVKLSSLLHDIEACQQSIPKVAQMELELTRVRDDIDAEQWRTQVLEEDLTDPKNPHRWTHIPLAIRGEAAVPKVAMEYAATNSAALVKASAAESGRGGPTASSSPGAAASSPPAADGALSRTANGSNAASVATAAAPTLVGGPSEEYVRLQARCQDLEARVQGITAKLREKDLVLEEVTELAERVGNQADSGKEVTLALAKQVNKYHSSIRNKSRQMMATISELSLFQASSIQLQQEVQRLEAVVEEAEQRMETGDAPFAEAEEQYERKKQSEQRYLAARQRQAAHDAEAGDAGQIVATTAPPRPNAYVPENDTLGLPRPYGTFAPFKPATARVMLTPARAEAWAGGRGGSPSPASPPASSPSASLHTSSSAAPFVRVPHSSATPTPPQSLPSAQSGPSAATATTTPAPMTTSFSSAVPVSRKAAAVDGSVASSAAKDKEASDRAAGVFPRGSGVAASHEQLRVSQRGKDNVPGVEDEFSRTH